jgi:hypothetical protein
MARGENAGAVGVSVARALRGDQTVTTDALTSFSRLTNRTIFGHSNMTTGTGKTVAKPGGISWNANRVAATSIVKNGRTATGQQQYHCHDCGLYTVTNDRAHERAIKVVLDCHRAGSAPGEVDTTALD